MSFFILVIVLLTLPRALSAQEEVKLHSSGNTSVNSLIYRLAQDNGFYRDEGLNVLAITATSQAGMQGLIAGSFDFSAIFGVGTTAILRGAPLKSVMVFDTRPLFWLYGGKKIKTLQDLKGGKIIAVSSLGANTDQITRDVLIANRIDPRREVVIQGIGPGSVRLQALFGGSVDATILNPLESLIAKRQGFNELLFYGDYDLSIASGGVIAREKMLTEKREFVRRFLRATLRAFHWVRANEKPAVTKMAEFFKISSDDAFGIYRASLKSYTADGTIPRGLQQRIIDAQRESLKLEKDIPPEKVFDFAIVNSLNEELKKRGS